MKVPKYTIFQFIVNFPNVQYPNKETLQCSKYQLAIELIKCKILQIWTSQMYNMKVAISQMYNIPN